MQHNASIQVGGGIITDGLVGYWSPTSKLSYEGEPTTNLVTQPLQPSWIGNTDAEHGFISREIINTPYGPGLRWIVEGTAYQATMLRPPIGSTISVTPGMYYTSSLYARTPETGRVQFALQGLDSENNRADGSSRTYTLTKDWVRYSNTWAMDDFDLVSTSNYMKLYLMALNANTTGIVEIALPQVELKPYPTPFTPTSRPVKDALKDLSGNNNHLDLTNVSFDSEGPYFNGEDNKITKSGWGELGSAWSIGGWVKFFQVDSQQIFISFSLPYLMILASLRTGLSWRDGENVQRTLYLPSQRAINLNEWCYIMGTHNGGNVARIFINGELATESSAYQGSQYVTNSLRLGHQSSSHYSNCRQDQMQIYNRALSPEEIRHNYNQVKSRYI